MVYVGHISPDRGAAEMIELARLLRAARHHGGAGRPGRRARPGRVLEPARAAGLLRWHGFVPNDQAMLIVDGALAGLSLLQDEPNFRHSMPTKVAEYMARGVPVVTTPLPLAVELVEPHECGFVVPFGGVPEAAAAVLALRRGSRAARRDGRARTRRRPASTCGWPEDARAFVAQLEQWAGVTGSGPSRRAGFAYFCLGRPIGSRCAQRGSEPPAAGRPSSGGPSSGRGPGRPAGAGLGRRCAR